MEVPQDTPAAKELAQAAWEARKHSWSPYSGFAVGAALRLEASGRIVVGCNVENASFGATICAERSAVLSAISGHGSRNFAMLAVATDAREPAVPCALCLQVLAEFCPPGFPLVLVNATGIVARYTLKDLLPHPFTSFRT